MRRAAEHGAELADEVKRRETDVRGNGADRETIVRLAGEQFTCADESAKRARAYQHAASITRNRSAFDIAAPVRSGARPARAS